MCATSRPFLLALLSAITTNVENVAAARREAARWAGILIKQLDAAHRLGGTD